MPAFRSALDDAANRGTIGVANLCPCRVAREMGNESRGECAGIGSEEVGQFTRSGELAAVGQFAAGIDRRTEFIGHPPRGPAFFGRLFALSVGAIAVTESTDGIEGFEGEAGRVYPRMTGGAAGVGTVLVELLAHGRGAAGVGIDQAHAGGRRRGGIVEKPVHHPDAARHR